MAAIQINECNVLIIIVVSGDVWKWSLEGLWLCMLQLTRGGDQSNGGNAWPNLDVKAVVRCSGSEKGWTQGSTKCRVYSKNFWIANVSKLLPQLLGYFMLIFILIILYVSFQYIGRRWSRLPDLSGLKLQPLNDFLISPPQLFASVNLRRPNLGK